MQYLVTNAVIRTTKAKSDGLTPKGPNNCRRTVCTVAKKEIEASNIIEATAVLPNSNEIENSNTTQIQRDIQVKERGNINISDEQNKKKKGLIVVFI